MRRAIRTKSPIGLATHARNALSYKQWHEARWPNINWLPLDETPGTRALHTAILVHYMEDMMDADVSPGAPRARLASLRVAIELCRPQDAWPVQEPIVKNLATVYFKEGKHKKRKVRLYTASEIATMEQRPASLSSPLDRLAITTELRKLYGRLRQDDTTWGKASDWTMVKHKSSGEKVGKHWHSVASKTKNTKTRANQIKETMAWIVPVGGIAHKQTHWDSTILNDMLEMLMRPTDGYLIPSPAAVRAQRRPPGAAEHTEWVNHLRKTLNDSWAHSQTHNADMAKFVRVDKVRPIPTGSEIPPLTGTRRNCKKIHIE